MKKVLIIGASGFIGHNLKDFLEKFPDEYELSCPSSKELNMLDLENVNSYFENNTFDIVVCAAIFIPKNYESQKDILDHDMRIFYYLQRHADEFEKIIYFGSGAEYVKEYPIVNVREEDFGRVPFSAYGFAKYIINKEIRNSSNIYNMRVFGLFGPYENWKTTFISGACCKAVKGVPITIRQNVFFEYVWIEDFVQIVKWFLDHTPKYHDYNITAGNKVDLMSLAEDVRKVSGKDIPIYVCKEGLANEYTGSNERLMKEIPEFKFTAKREAIQKLYKWYEQREETIDLMSLLYFE